MTRLWHRENPTLYETEKSTVETYFSDLSFAVVGDFVHVRGTFPVMFQGQILDRYQIHSLRGRGKTMELHIFQKPLT